MQINIKKYTSSRACELRDTPGEETHPLVLPENGERLQKNGHRFRKNGHRFLPMPPILFTRTRWRAPRAAAFQKITFTVTFPL